MSDAVATYGLDYSAVKRGLAEMEGASDRSARRMHEGWARSGQSIGRELLKGFGAFAAARQLIGFGADSLTKYATVSDAAAESQRRFREAVENLQISIGRDLSVAMGGVDFAGFVDKLNGARMEFRGWITDLIEGKGAYQELLAAQLEVEQAGMAAKFQRQFDRFSGQQMVETERLRGHGETADQLEEAVKHQAKLEEIRSLEFASEQSKNFLIEREKFRHGEAVKAINERTRQKREAAADDARAMGSELPELFRKHEAEEAERQKRRESTRAELDDQLEMMRIERERTGGHARQAEADRERLELRKRLRDLDADPTLSDEEKDHYRRRLTEETEAGIAAGAGGRRRTARSLGAGLGDLSSMVFGGGARAAETPQVREARTHTGLLKRMDATLVKIADGVWRGGDRGLTLE